MSFTINLLHVCLILYSVLCCHCYFNQCPNGWVEFERCCYKFSRLPRKNVNAAFEECANYAGSLVSVNTLDEHTFISHWLRDNDPQHLLWYTSGRDIGNNVWRWDGDKKFFTNIQDFWLKQEYSVTTGPPNFYPTRSPSYSSFTPNYGSSSSYNSQQNSYSGQQQISQGIPSISSSYSNVALKYAAYNFSGPENRWALVPTSGTDEAGYICEVAKSNLLHVFGGQRNIDYGTPDLSDSSKILRGPKFIHEPKAAIFDLSGRSQMNSVALRCVADGFPTPSYRWFKEEYQDSRPNDRYIDPLADPRYTQTDGTLIISNPQQTTDRGKYHCKASNTYGTIISETVQLSFGFLGEFNKKRSDDNAKENWGKSISCDAPQHNPRIDYYWTRNSFPNFVEEDARVFVSKDGNLYFSTIEKIDRANYSCNIQSVISSTGRRGPFFQLITEPGSSGQKLLFPNNFPKSFPDSALTGEDVRLECIAYGYPVPSYNWTRIGVTNRLPHGAYTANHNRVLMIPNIKIEDQGEYLCTATSGRELVSKAVTLSIQSLPIFTVNLTDQITERGATVTFTCEAFGIPEVTYKWFKNGRELNAFEINRATNGRYKIRENILTIDSVTSGSENDPSGIDGDDGMYQCQASNALGARYSSGQLKVMALRPVFNKHKLDSEMHASIGSNFTIPCIPEAMPFPKFTWSFGNRPISDGGRIRTLPNGFLFFSSVDQFDSGLYTCRVKNEFGSAEISTYLTVFPKPKVVEHPRPKELVIVNDTIQLPCLAYTENSLDVAYTWLHNGLPINFTRMPQYTNGTDRGYLKIQNVTFAEAGNYTCLVKTSISEVATHTELLVNGPPSAPGAITADELSSNSAKIIWSDGSDNGRRILTYTIEGRTNHNSTWQPLAQYITNVHTEIQTGRKSVNINGVLSPWSSYEFRVLATNELGTGAPSEPSPQYNTDKAPPYKYPSNINGGGGKAGTLTITWDPLTPQDWNSPELWYKVFYKSLETDLDYRFKELKMSDSRSSTGSMSSYTINVGEENYYKRYLVKVQAINSQGAGPESPEVEVYSAEAMPQVQPSLVRALPFNSTSLNVSWAPVDVSREKLRGKLVGHRIKYWRSNYDPTQDSLTLLNRGQDNWGLIVALQPDTEYYVTVMAYNDAGSGPESERVLQRTYKAAPQRPPTSVKVRAIDRTSVMVTWRGGASVTVAEEPIIGYKVRYWESDQPIAKAKEVYKKIGDDTELEAVISGLVPGKVYKLRVLAYSLGGDGKMSSPPEEFIIGSGETSTSGRLTSNTISLHHTPLHSFFSFIILQFAFIFCLT